MFNYNIEIADRCSEMLARDRTNAKLSRKMISREIGVSESTIKAWEMGQGSPTLPVLVEWFKATGCNPFRAFIDFFWPELFQGLSAEKSDGDFRRALSVYFSEIAGQLEIQKLHFLVFNDFGGEWSGLLDMFCAHSQMSLKSRCRMAEMIQIAYELSRANNNARILSDFEVNRVFLLDAIEAAKKASLIHKDGYIITNMDMNFSEVASSILRRSRVDSGVSQLYMAKAMGKSERTIQNWESTSEPTFLEICLWCRILDKKVWDYLRNAIDPSEPFGTNENDRHLRNDLTAHFNAADSKELRKLAYLILGKYGSYWNAVLEMMVEHVCTPLYQRIMTARSMLISYELDSNDTTARCTEVHIRPDLDNLKECIELATEAAKVGHNTYHR